MASFCQTNKRQVETEPHLAAFHPKTLQRWCATKNLFPVALPDKTTSSRGPSFSKNEMKRAGSSLSCCVSCFLARSRLSTQRSRARPPRAFSHVTQIWHCRTHWQSSENREENSRAWFPRPEPPRPQHIDYLNHRVFLKR